MERGPMALFGAIVAIGLGPALWLGAQFGDLEASPSRPPTVVSEQNADKASGGAGAAQEEPAIEPTRRMKYVPLSGTPSARPSTSATADDPDDQATSTPPASAEPTGTDDPATPPVESTTDPADPTEPSTGDEDPAGPDPGDPVGGQAAGESQS